MHGAAEVVHHHRRAPPRQVDGVQPAQPTPGTGHDRDLSCIVDHVALTPIPRVMLADTDRPRNRLRPSRFCGWPHLIDSSWSGLYGGTSIWSTGCVGGSEVARGEQRRWRPTPGAGHVSFRT